MTSYFVASVFFSELHSAVKTYVTSVTMLMTYRNGATETLSLAMILIPFFLLVFFPSPACLVFLRQSPALEIGQRCTVQWEQQRHCVSDIFGAFWDTRKVHTATSFYRTELALLLC